MLETMMVYSGSVMYVMVAVGILGVLAKIVNRLTLYRLIKAAGNMPKSTHRLMKLVRAKYEHACMAHDSVENIDVFVEKYIYEYRGFLFRIHTWRQIEILSVWFVGILAALGATFAYIENGLSETVYQFIAGGAAEAVLLAVIIRMSDEPYKVKAIKMYMVDYLQNVCALKLRKQSRREKEFIDVIPADSANGGSKSETVSSRKSKSQEQIELEEGSRVTAGSGGQSADVQCAAVHHDGVTSKKEKASSASKDIVAAARDRILEFQGENGDIMDETGSNMVSKGLPINIEEEPQTMKKTEQIRRGMRGNAVENVQEERPQIREETIRQILEEFLA